MENIKQKLGKNIRYYRKQKKMTQFTLAEKVDKSEETISNIERGIPATSIDLLEQIAAVLGVNIHELIDRNYAPPPIQKEQKILFEIMELLQNKSDNFLIHIAELLKECSYTIK
jgi:transcriptional regulator with XRE-family HTH domain